MIILIFAAVWLSNGVTLNCSFVDLYFGVGHYYTCDVKATISDGNLTHVLNITGNHSSGKSNADVNGFWISRSQFNHVLLGIDKFFTNLHGFGWIYGKLKTVSSNDLEPFHDLKIVSFAYNELSSLDGDLFTHTPNITWIEFHGNRLENVGFGLLDGLNNFTNAHFKSNPCINFNAKTPAEIQELKLMLQKQCSP